MEGVFSLEESLESLKFLNCLESLEKGRTLLCFQESGGSLECLESLNSLESLENVRKIRVSVKFVSAILGPEMGAPILWTPGKMRSFCRKNHVRKIPFFFGGVWGGGECRFYFYGRADFSENGFF